MTVTCHTGTILGLVHHCRTHVRVQLVYYDANTTSTNLVGVVRFTFFPLAKSLNAAPLTVK